MDELQHSARLRTALLLGDAAMSRLSTATVVVAGLGGVGGHAVDALARAGVGCLRLVDFDTVDPTNLNRQLPARTSTVGAVKVRAAAEHISDVAPWCRIEPMPLFIDSGNIADVLAGPVDMVVDAIDTFDSKLLLICESMRRGLPVVSSMGAGRRVDATQVRASELARTQGCPMAKRLRRALRGFEPMGDLTCIYSLESARAAAAESEGSTSGRMPVGSLSAVTGVFGLAAAGEVIRRLAGC